MTSNSALILLTSGDGAAEMRWAETVRDRFEQVVTITTAEPVPGAHRASAVRTELGDGVGAGACAWVGLWLTTAERLVFCDVDRHGTPDVDEIATLLDALDAAHLVFLDRAHDCLDEHLLAPAISLHHPDLAGRVTPRPALWAAQRDHLDMLPFPVGEGAELAVLLDTVAMYGPEGIATVPGSATGGETPPERVGHEAAVQLLITLERRLPQRLPVADDPLIVRGQRLRVDEAPPVAALPGYTTRDAVTAP